MHIKTIGENKMTIYLVKEYSGQYEDYHEYIRYCTSNKIKAENKKAELEQAYEIEMKQAKKCSHCEAVWFDKKDYDEIKEKMKTYCNMFKVENYDDDVYDCESWCSLFDESTFKIVEMECEE
jgi:phage terminase large subunit-like protein